MKFGLLVPALAALLLVSTPQAQSGSIPLFKVPEESIEIQTSTAPPNTCYGQPVGAYLPDPEDCKIYYICLGGDQGTMEECPSNLLFDPVNLRCVLPAQMPPSAPCLRNICTGERDGTYLADPDDCQKFSICFNEQVGTEDYCPGNLLFNVDTEKCVWPHYLPTTSRCYPRGTPFKPDCSRQPDGTQIADPSDCQPYWICSGGVGEKYVCPAGLVYDRTYSKTCRLAWDIPQEVPCGEFVSTTTSKPISPTEPEPTPPWECGPWAKDGADVKCTTWYDTTTTGVPW